MEKIPTANDFYNEDLSPLQNMIEFAKLHVEAALKAASENVDYYMLHTTDHSEPVPVIIEDSILNSYPLENIK